MSLRLARSDRSGIDIWSGGLTTLQVAQRLCDVAALSTTLAEPYETLFRAQSRRGGTWGLLDRRHGLGRQRGCGRAFLSALVQAKRNRAQKHCGPNELHGPVCVIMIDAPPFCITMRASPSPI